MMLRLEVLAVVLVTLDICWGQCYNTNWSDTKEECKDGYSEAYKKQAKSNNQWLTMCCQTGTTDDKNQKLYADACQETPCYPTYAGTYDLCDSGISLRTFINDREILFEETVRGQCKGVYDNKDEIGIKVLCCHKNSTETLITTLYGTEPNEFPHWARLGTGGCGGTLYNKKYVVTAAHCVINEETHKVLTKGDADWDSSVGTVSININMANVYTTNQYKVKTITVHPNTSHLKPPDDLGTSYNDVALLELEDEVQFNDNVKALRIADKGFDPLKYGDHAIIVGFGTTDTLRLSKKLQKANLKLRKKDDTFNRHTGFSYMVKYKDQLLPLGGIVNGVANPIAGTGDSGGPAICKDANGEAVLCGITSFTIPNPLCLSNLDETYCMPAVYNDVQYFSDWIKSIAGEQQEDQLMKQKVFGYPAGPNEYLSQVHITASDGTSCGGTLIAQDLVLTAAHCIIDDNGFNKGGLKFMGGVRSLKDKPKETTSLKNSADLPGFEKAGKSRKKRVISLVLETWQANKTSKPPISDGPYYKNDLAIVKLKKPLSSSKVATIGSVMDASRIAKEVSLPKPNSYSDKLSVRDFKILTNDDCQQRMDRLTTLGYNVKLADNVMCGVETYSGGSLCDREVGGGLFCKGPKGKEVLCGVQVFRLCEFNVPNVFIDLSKNKDWLDAAIDALKNA